jgi:nucleotide-binding universal stress UspA family protein
MTAELLIATNGFKGTWSAIEYGIWFAEAMRMKITFLGVTESLSPAAMADHYPLEELMDRAVSLCKQKGVEYRIEAQSGEAEQVIPEKANSGDFITVVSPLGRPKIKQWLVGRSIRLLLEKIKVPILYVPETRLPLKKLLVSIGGLGYEVEAENLAFRLASAVGADVTILHVIPPIDLDYPSTRKVRRHVKDLAETNTLPGRSLKKALEIAQQAGLNAKVSTRQGNVVEEILLEIRDGDYDMVCMGSSYSAHTLRQLYTPNVTAEVAEAARCPLLTARHKSA